MRDARRVRMTTARWFVAGVPAALALRTGHGIHAEPTEQTGLCRRSRRRSRCVRVVLYATVRERRRLRRRPDRHDFTILEDGKPQKLLEFQREDVPVAIGLLVDNSRSMLTRRDEVVEAAKTFVRATNPQDEIFVCTSTSN
jgi:hypothetical protein